MAHPTEMELRVARALCSRRGQPRQEDLLNWIDDAKVAINAMRVPTAEMLGASGADERAYATMIAAASPPEAVIILGAATGPASSQ